MDQQYYDNRDQLQNMQPQQQSYNNANYNNNNYNNGMNSNNEPVSVGDWMVTMIIFAIPIVGLVMMFVWAFGDGTNPSKKNYCRAALIMAAIGIVLGILMLISCSSLLASMFGAMAR